MKKKALITGISGQDGSYLAEFLLAKGYEVHGIIRRSSVFTTKRLDKIWNNPNLNTHHGDLTDSGNLNNLIREIHPLEVYNLGAQSHVGVSFEVPEYTANVDALGVIRLLDAIKSYDKKIKFYQASTSELFGKVTEVPQNEHTPFYPRSPYAAAKLYAFWITKNYREAYGLFTCNGILFNHESPRRGGTFVTKKITKAVANIAKGNQKKLFLGNLDAKRDWGHAKDYVSSMWLMLQKEKPNDYVIASGENHTVREFVEKSFKYVDIDIVWKGKGLDEKGIDIRTGRVLVEVNSKYFRPTEVESLLGNSAKAEKDLNWIPKVSFDRLIEVMVKYDLEYEDYGGGELF